MELTERQWSLIHRYLSPGPRRRGGRGRPYVPDRKPFEGILWVLRSGARWKDLPREYGSKATAHRRFQRWCRDGSLQRAFAALIRMLDRKGYIEWEEAFVDASFVDAKKGVKRLRPLAAEKARSGLLSPKAEEDYPLQRRLTARDVARYYLSSPLLEVPPKDRAA